jgi:hypothetical protein
VGSLIGSRRSALPAQRSAFPAYHPVATTQPATPACSLAAALTQPTAPLKPRTDPSMQPTPRAVTLPVARRAWLQRAEHGEAGPRLSCQSP